MSILAFNLKPHANAAEKDSWSANVAIFEQELSQLQNALSIPGIAYVIVQGDRVIAKKAIGNLQTDKRDRIEAFSVKTPLRIASVTKSLTALVVLQLVEEGKLGLDEPVVQYIPELATRYLLPKNTTIRHLLTHTSENTLGETFVYSTNRFSLLARVIEKADNRSFQESLNIRVLTPAKMTSFASPNLGAHAGLVSNVEQMAKFLKAIHKREIISPESYRDIVAPTKSKKGKLLPVSLGWFSQNIQGQRVVWSFGQDEPRHSGALLLMLPDQNISIFILANANAISDPFRLFMGDVSKSPFALSFLRLFAFSKPGSPMAVKMGLFSHAFSSQKLAIDRYDFNDELLAGALIDIWKNEFENAQDKMNTTLNRAGGNAHADPVLHYAAMRLPAVSIKQRAAEAGKKLLELYPDNRWILLAQGYLYQQLDRNEESIEVFNRIIQLQNQHPDLLHQLFKVWSWQALAEMTQYTHPKLALSYLEKIFSCGIQDESVARARQLSDAITARL